jgi:DNA-binding beta-propeller fold protein YncE
LYKSIAAVSVIAFALFAPPSGFCGGEKETAPENMVYVQTNDYTSGKNAINAYRRDPVSGCLSLLGSYETGGTGLDNFDDRIGPDDHAQEVIASPDRKLLFTVNGGSDTISVFRINSDGSLTLAKGSQVPSGGIQPVSLGLSGNKLYVVNQNGDPNRLNSGAPNYTGFRVAGNGHLSPIPHSTIELPNLSYPTQALISKADGGALLFGDLLTAVPYSPQLAPFLPAAGSL